MWNRKADGAAIDREKKILYLLEFKRTTDQRSDFEKKATVRAERQSEDVVGALMEVRQGHGAGMDSEAFNIRRRHKWVSAHGEELERTPSPQIKVERD